MLRCFEDALAERLEEGDVQRIRIARWCMTCCLRSLWRLQEVLRIQQDLLAEQERSGGEDRYIYEGLVACF